MSSIHFLSFRAANHSFNLTFRRFSWWRFVRTQPAGDVKYKSMVQQARIRVPGYPQGKAQHITFPPIPNQKAGIKSLQLPGTSDAGLKVYYYVRESPAGVRGAKLLFTPVPPRSKFPVRVTAVAWQHGLPGKVKTAEPVTQTFFIHEK